MTGTNTRLDALNTSNAALKSSIDAKLDALNATTAANKTDLTATNTKLDGIKDSYELGNDGVKLLLGELNTNTVANKTDLTATNAKLDALNTAIVENKTTVDFTATNAKLDALNATTAANKTDLTATNAKLDALNATTAANKTDLTATNTKLDGIKDSYEVGNDGVKLLLGELTLVTSNNKIDLTATNSKLDQINTSIVENKTTVDLTATNAKLDAINDTLAVLADDKNGEKLDRIGNLIETENTRKITQEEDLTEAVADQVTQGQNHNAEAGTIGQSAAALMAKAPTVPSAANFGTPSNDFYKVTHGNRTFNLNPLADPRLSPIAAFARSLAVWAVCFVFLGVLVKNCSWLLESVSSAQTTTAGPTTIAGFGSSYPAGVIKAAACVTLIMALIPLSYAAFTGLLAGFDPTSIISINPFSSALEAAGNSIFAAEGLKLLNQFLPLDLCVIATVTALIHKFTVQSLSIALSTAFRWITG
jgi:predicted  nucleic acid-binding Zn-ribbon protein